MARPQDAEARRGEILDRAFALFAEHGYHALSMRDLAQRLGATTGTLYHWFDGKPSLFSAMLERQVLRQVTAAVTEVVARPLPARMAALGAFVAREADDLQRTLAVSVDYQRAHPESTAPLAGALTSYRDAMAGELGLAPEEARLVLSVIIGELLQRVLDPTRDLSVLVRVLPALARPIPAS
jgi:AcrR family transcriptional regulator